MDKNVLNNISYGLYVLTTREDDKDNGCIINTVQQVTTSPCVISVTVNKENHTHDMLIRTGKFNVSCISIDTEFDVFDKFGFVSGKDADKFADWKDVDRSSNGICYLTKGVNGYLSGQVFHTVDMGTHTLFLAKVTDMESLSEDPSLTYAYYHRPSSQSQRQRKTVATAVSSVATFTKATNCRLTTYAHGANTDRKILRRLNRFLSIRKRTSVLFLITETEGGRRF